MIVSLAGNLGVCLQITQSLTNPQNELIVTVHKLIGMHKCTCLWKLNSWNGKDCTSAEIEQLENFSQETLSWEKGSRRIWTRDLLISSQTLLPQDPGGTEWKQSIGRCYYRTHLASCPFPHERMRSFAHMHVATPYQRPLQFGSHGSKFANCRTIHSE